MLGGPQEGGMLGVFIAKFCRFPGNAGREDSQASSSGVCYRDESGEIAVDHRKESKGGLSVSQVENVSQNCGLTQRGRGGGKAGIAATRFRGALPECR